MSPPHVLEVKHYYNDSNQWAASPRASNQRVRHPQALVRVESFLVQEVAWDSP